MKLYFSYVFIIIFAISENTQEVPNNINAQFDVTVSHVEELHQNINSVKSGNGWVWIGGIKGESKNPYEAIKEAMDKLTCRYARSIFFLLTVLLKYVSLRYIILLDLIIFRRYTHPHSLNLSQTAKYLIMFHYLIYLTNFSGELMLHGQKLEDICSISMFISDMSQYSDLNRLYCEVLNHVNPPSRACVQVPLPSNCPVILEALSWNANTVVNATGDLQIERL